MSLLQLTSRRSASPATALPATPTHSNPNSLGDFHQQIEQEFVVGSAIAPDLFAASIHVVPDLVVRPGGEVEAPIHAALNWHYSRFRQQANQTLFAALFQNEDGSTWQAKLSQTRTDSKGKTRRYEAPAGNGSRAFLPTVPAAIRANIAQRYRIRVPSEGSFWDWLVLHPEVPIIWTEGGKKALALLSLGYVAIALYGVNSGYCTKDAEGNAIPAQLIADVARFCRSGNVPGEASSGHFPCGRQSILAFDQDSKPSTRRRVSIALSRFGGLLAAGDAAAESIGVQPACPLVAHWRASQGKGVDDLIVNRGAAAWHAAVAAALPLEHWQIWNRLEQRRAWLPDLKLCIPDLSKAALSLPISGILAIDSAKGTGKTKLIGQLIASSPAVVLLGHRVALQRNLCQRLGLHYRADLDRVNGELISSAGYATRIGLCVDSLLSLDIERFIDCDLIIDEVVQVLRHLLTSSTCNKDGKRPLLLAKLAQLMRVARRIIVADADLDSATLHYLKELCGCESRGTEASVPEVRNETALFLLRNSYQPTGYACQFIQARERSAIVRLLFEAIHALPQGKVLFIPTDSKALSRSLHRLIQEAFPEKRILVLNSETANGPAERQFVATPDAVLKQGEVDIVIASPTFATGGSIEVSGIIQSVFGIFSGVSSTDADIAQALSRVREPVERIVWVAERGSNFSSVSRSASAIELKRQLFEATRTGVSLLRNSLKADSLQAVESYDWRANPHINLWSAITAEQNRSMHSLRLAVLMRLRYEGNQVSIDDQESDPTYRLLLRDAKAELKLLDAAAIAAAAVLSHAQVLELERQESSTVEDQQALSLYYLKEFYCQEQITAAEIMQDNEGRRRSGLRSLEEMLYPGVAADRSLKALERQTAHGQSICPWDLNQAETQRQLRLKLGLNDFLDPNKEWTKYDTMLYAIQIRAWVVPVKQALHLTVSDKMSDTQLLHQLLSQLGLKISFRWSRAVEGHEGEKLRVYRLDAAGWLAAMEVLERRCAKRESLQAEAGSPGCLIDKEEVGDPGRQQNLEPLDAAESSYSLFSPIDDSNEQATPAPELPPDGRKSDAA